MKKSKAKKPTLWKPLYQYHEPADNPFKLVRPKVTPLKDLERDHMKMLIEACGMIGELPSIKEVCANEHRELSESTAASDTALTKEYLEAIRNHPASGNTHSYRPPVISTPVRPDRFDMPYRTGPTASSSQELEYMPYVPGAPSHHTLTLAQLQALMHAPPNTVVDLPSATQQPKSSPPKPTTTAIPVPDHKRKLILD